MSESRTPARSGEAEPRPQAEATEQPTDLWSDWSTLSASAKVERLYAIVRQLWERGRIP